MHPAVGGDGGGGGVGYAKINNYEILLVYVSALDRRRKITLRITLQILEL